MASVDLTNPLLGIPDIVMNRCSGKFWKKQCLIGIVPNTTAKTIAPGPFRSHSVEMPLPGLSPSLIFGVGGEWAERSPTAFEY